MASSTSKLSFFFLLLLFSIVAAKEEEDLIHLHYFFHDIRIGPNATSAVVAGLNDTSGFGRTIVFDGPLTEGPELSSKLVGRAQGLTVMASLSDSSLLGMLNQVFTDGEYSGSTIAIFGRSDASTGIADRAIVGGSGKFRLARGYTIAKIVERNSTYGLAEYNTYIYLSA